VKFLLIIPVLFLGSCAGTTSNEDVLKAVGNGLELIEFAKSLKEPQK